MRRALYALLLVPLMLAWCLLLVVAVGMAG